MSIKTVGELIAALQRLPDNMLIGTMAGDYVGEKFEPTVRIEREFVKPSGRLGEMGEAGVEVLAIR